MIEYLKSELAHAEAMEREAAQQAEIARTYIANHAKYQVIVAHLRQRLGFHMDQAAPIPDAAPAPAPAPAPDAPAPAPEA